MADVDLLERSLFLTRFGGGGGPPVRALVRLHALATREPGGSLDASVEWLEDAIGWIVDGGRLAGRRADESDLGARTRVFLDVLEHCEPVRRTARLAFQTVLAGTSATALFTDMGLPTHAGFWRELGERVLGRLLPAPPVAGDFGRFVGRLLASERVVRWLGGLGPQARDAFAEALGLDDIERSLTPALHEACLVLAARLASLGTAQDFRKRIPDVAAADSPFLRLPRLVPGVLDGLIDATAFRAGLLACRQLMRRARGALEQTGISIDLVFRMELMSASLSRLEVLVSAARGGDSERARAWSRLEDELVRSARDERSVRAVWTSNTRLLAKRLVERAGEAGEHYITRTRAEQHAMFSAAAGGGLVTALFVVTKFALYWSELPPFFDALAVGLNYGLGFVIMQLCHFALATKQPAMTAATLSGAIAVRSEGSASPRTAATPRSASEVEGARSLGAVELESSVVTSDEQAVGELAEQVARASRTQLFALLGNVGAVVPVALLLDGLQRLVTGRPLLELGAAERIVAAHHPWTSGTMLHAAMTGVWLWAASLLAGAADNWFTLREQEGAIATNRRLRRWIGPGRASAVAHFVRRQVSGFGGNVGFGLLLGFAPLVFELVGIPLEVRHVTFVAGQLAYAASSIGLDAGTRPEFLLALLSVPLVGAINFAVSFALALVVALRARGLGVRAQASLGVSVLTRLARTPRDFVLAPESQPIPHPRG